MDELTVVNPLLEKVMKETALDKVRQKIYSEICRRS